MDSIILALEIVGTIAFAVSGAMVSINKRLDIFGVIFCSVVTALGGGEPRVFVSSAVRYFRQSLTFFHSFSGIRKPPRLLEAAFGKRTDLHRNFR